ncbi:MAG: phosphopyruvate hydratase, partial [Firmicutes bacterium]|nr:phosphopyruvate hydratase [Bacillota bacterium]
AILGVSLAVMNAAARAENVPLYRYIGGAAASVLPVPLLNVLNGGAHADNNVDIQEFMIVPWGAETMAQAMQMASETYHALQALLKAQGLRTAVGDEGGFAPDLPSNQAALDLLMQAIEKAGWRPQEDIALAIDAAATEFYHQGGYRFEGQQMSSGDLIGYYEQLVRQYPIISIEDGLAEDDWEGWTQLTAQVGKRVQLVGDDLFVTNVTRLQKGLTLHAANAILIKPNQIGSASETLETIRRAQKNGWHAMISHRSGETDDTVIADLAVGTNSGQIKAGAPARGERAAKYNRLLLIAAQDSALQYGGKEAFHQ